MRSIARLRPALVAPVAVLALVLAGCSADDPVATDPAAEPSTSENQDPSTEPSEDPEPSDDDSSDAGTTTTAAYFIGDTERAGPNLRRLDATVEFSPSRMTPLRRLGRPVEVAHAVLFLASEEASYITGHTLAVAGGR